MSCPRWSILATCAVILVAQMLTSVASAAGSDTLKRPKIIAVHVSADWCEPCEGLNEKVEMLADRFDGEPVLGIIIDVTDLSTRHHSQMLAAALGLEELWRTHRGDVGVIYLLDAETKALIDTLTPENSFEEMSAKVLKVLTN